MRRSQRVTPSVTIEGTTRYDTSVRVVDLSPSGALVEAGRSVPKGSSLRLQLTSDGQLLSLRAQVSRAYPGEDGIYCLGLQFGDMSEEERAALTRLVEQGSRTERRAQPRIYVGSSAQLTKEVELKVLNLGLFGGLFRLDAPLEFNSHHDFVFTLPQGEVRARGVVRHCEAWVRPSETARFRLGVEFTELVEVYRERVVAYLEEQIQAS